MRLHNYQFPDGIDPHTRHLNGAVCISGICEFSHSGKYNQHL